MLLDSPTFWLTALLLVLTVQETVSHLVVCAEYYVIQVLHQPRSLIPSHIMYVYRYSQVYD